MVAAGLVDAHRRGRHDLVRAGRVRRHGRLCHRLGLHLAGPGRRAGRLLQPGLAAVAGLLLGLVLAAAVAWGLGAITLKLSGHYLPLCTIAWGLSIYFLFGNLEVLGGQTGTTGLPPLVVGALSLAAPRALGPVIWGDAAAGAVGAAQPARLARGPRHPRAQGRPPDGRVDGRGHGGLPRQGLRAGRPAGRAVGLALRAPAALREPDALQPQHRHRIPVHGRGGRRRPPVGRGAGRGAGHAAEVAAAGRAAAAAGQQRQLRSDRLRPADAGGAAPLRRRAVADAGARRRTASFARRPRCAQDSRDRLPEPQLPPAGQVLLQASQREPSASAA